MQINQMPIEARPREKLLSKGASSLTDAELLAIFLRTGIKGLNAIELADTLLKQQGSIGQLFSLECDSFCQQLGLGPAKYVQLQAVLELSKRFFAEQLQREAVFDSPYSVINYLKCELQKEHKECFYLLLLDSQNRLIKSVNLFQGTINAASVYPREVVTTVLKYNAANVILAHNHPSGIAEPSEADKLITKRLSDALALIDVSILDHIIIAAGNTHSFAEHGQI
ncbi:MAG: RadC family protein [Pseudoalteromonas spongiae]